MQLLITISNNMISNLNKPKDEWINLQNYFRQPTGRGRFETVFARFYTNLHTLQNLKSYFKIFVCLSGLISEIEELNLMWLSISGKRLLRDKSRLLFISLENIWGKSPREQNHFYISLNFMHYYNIYPIAMKH